MSGESPMEISHVPETTPTTEGLFYIHEIRTTSTSASWPAHIKEAIVTVGGKDPRPMTLDEVGAILLHVAMLETGFVPHYANMHPLNEQEVLQNRMTLIRRCVTGLQMPERDRNALRLKYSGVQFDTNPPEKIHRRFVPTTNVDVLMTYWNGSVDVETLATLPEPVAGGWNCKFSYSMNLRQFINPIQGLGLSPTTLLNPEAWLNIIRLDGLKFANAVKREFCIPVLDSIDGYLYEIRITDLPREVLENIFTYLSAKQLSQVRVVTKNFRAIATYVLKGRNQRRVGSINRRRVTVSSQW